MFGAWGTVSATLEQENCRTWGTYRNTLSIHTKYWPVVEVASLSYSAQPGGLANGQGASITPAGNVTIYPQSFEVSLGGSTQFFTGGLQGFGGFGTTGVNFRTEYDVEFSYVAGWPNTTLSASVAAGATSLTPMTVVGIYPGSLMTLYDLPWDEPIQVSPNYVPGTATVALTSELQYNHAATATITNLPPAIKQAAILVTTAFIKQRGSGALIVADMGVATDVQHGTGAQQSGSDMSQAMMLMDAFRQQYVGY